MLLLVLFGSAFAVGRASGPLQPGIRPTDPGPSGGDHDMPGMRHDMPGMDHDMPGMEDMPGMTMSGLGPLRSSSAAAGTAPAPARQVRR
ncbi:hypothetical protein [Peterkaempfera bronchialis]|uniref:hypothetical protein n=1 Tax=Peterkaempfera bronchialis TaxID=2126346 RepID=UPI001588BCBB|nr:hypothetical protein [Peterkaempfera bronchialis]